MILRALIFSVAVFALLAVIALLVAGLIKLIYMIVHRNKDEKPADKKAEVKSAT